MDEGGHLVDGNATPDPEFVDDGAASLGGSEHHVADATVSTDGRERLHLRSSRRKPTRGLQRDAVDDVRSLGIDVDRVDPESHELCPARVVVHAPPEFDERLVALDHLIPGGVGGRTRLGRLGRRRSVWCLLQEGEEGDDKQHCEGPLFDVLHHTVHDTSFRWWVGVGWGYSNT